MSDDRRLAMLKHMVQSTKSPYEYLLNETMRARLRFVYENGRENHTFFWKSNSCFSQWYPTKFIGQGILWYEESYLKGMPNQIEFNCAEQYMMYHKAMLFLDRETAKKILRSNNPKEQKQLGRKVKNFNERVWNHKKVSTVYWGNELKFKQNEECKSQLMETVKTTLVEASPYDKVWGIGLSKRDKRAHDRCEWKGLNLLGEILTLIRVKFNNEIY